MKDSKLFTLNELKERIIKMDVNLDNQFYDLDYLRELYDVYVRIPERALKISKELEQDEKEKKEEKNKKKQNNLIRRQNEIFDQEKKRLDLDIIAERNSENFSSFNCDSIINSDLGKNLDKNFLSIKNKFDLNSQFSFGEEDSDDLKENDKIYNKKKFDHFLGNKNNNLQENIGMDENIRLNNIKKLENINQINTDNKNEKEFDNYEQSKNNIHHYIESEHKKSEINSKQDIYIHNIELTEKKESNIKLNYDEEVTRKRKGVQEINLNLNINTNSNPIENLNNIPKSENINNIENCKLDNKGIFDPIYLFHNINNNHFYSTNEYKDSHAQKNNFNYFIKNKNNHFKYEEDKKRK
jgi:hypothetical protein